VILWMLIVVGGLRVAIAIVNAERFDAEATIALMAFCLGAAWGMRRWRKPRSPS
jgi:hypothetical protein